MTRHTLISLRELILRLAGILGMVAVFVLLSWGICRLVG